MAKIPSDSFVWFTNDIDSLEHKRPYLTIIKVFGMVLMIWVSLVFVLTL